MVGLISELEERDSAKFNGFTWNEWQKLPYLDRVDGVAYSRLTHIIDIVKEDAVSREMDHRARRGGSKRR